MLLNGVLTGVMEVIVVLPQIKIQNGLTEVSSMFCGGVLGTTFLALCVSRFATSVFPRIPTLAMVFVAC